MINLLPPKEKKELFREQKKRIVVIFGSIILISLFCLISILFSIKTHIFEEVESRRIILEQIKKEYETSDIKNLQKIIREYNENLLKLKSFYEKQIYLSEVLEKISKIQPSEIYFTNFLLEKEKDNKVAVAISGFSKTRENLTLFKENLEKEKNFENLYFSPTSWIKPTDINFNLTFEVHPVK